MVRLNADGLRPTEADIAELEQDGLIALPPDYRSFLIETNGGRVDGNWYFKISDAEGETALSHFYRIVDSKKRSAWTLRYTRSPCSPRMPENLMPIGSDAFGGKICIQVSGSDRGKIYY